MQNVVMLLLINAPFLLTQETEKHGPRDQFQRLLIEYDAAKKAWADQYDRFNVEEIRASAVNLERRYRAWPGWSFAPRFLKLAEDYPHESAAVDALLQVTVEIGRPVSPNDRQLLPHYKRALELLSRDYLDDERLATVVQALRGYRSPSAERFLRNMMERSHKRSLRAMACMNLAGSLVAQREMALKPWFDDPEISPFKSFLAGRWDPEVLRSIREADPQALTKEAKDLYELAITEYGDVVWWKDPKRLGRQETIAAAARMHLADLRLSVGTVAPEIEGLDIDGLPMRLSDHRGNVVVLSFWGSWCGPCMAVVPRERSLVERFTGRPFILLGVNSDEDPKNAKKVAKQARMTWRSWCDGIPAGPIATQWGVHEWPMIYVIDIEGVIRYKSGYYDKKLDEIVGNLLNRTPQRGN